ncbi:MAG: peptidylprolyl isomerase [Clostridium sp.]|nr:peptidylprolyl isomerase [Clostridium sp.]
MKKTFLAAAIIASAAIALAKDADPVLMTVAGRDVYLSEFEYLYNKNNAQQSQALSFDEYLSMFVNYKLKVADAMAHGVDTTASFVDEFNKYSRELAQPYLRDNDMIEKMAQAEYARMPKERYVSHIMLQIDPANETESREKAESLRVRILSGDLSFESAASSYSIDHGSSMQGGRMGWVTASSRLPQAFTDMCYETPIGEISPVVNSGYGLHIIRPEEERPVQGEVNAKHILMLTQGMDEDGRERQKARIDSIYNALSQGADFADLARRLSEDPGSARNGGDLGWFGTGRMVPEFENAAFALKDGEISKPFASAFGWHIIYRVAHRGDTIPPYEEARADILKRFELDGRMSQARSAYLQSVAARTNSKLNEDLASHAMEFLSAKGVTEMDSAAIAMLMQADIEAYTVQGKSVKLRKAFRGFRSTVKDPIAASRNIAFNANLAFEEEMSDIAQSELEGSNAEYRNLLNEYRDGIMLFDRANEMVWEKASADKEGLEKFFLSNRANYAWEAPKYKAYVIFANSDSIMRLAQSRAETLSASSLKHEDFTQQMKQAFGNSVKVERVIAAKGENPYTDNLGFGMPRPAANSRWPYYFAFQGKVIDAPESAEDVRGLLITDYQNYLEKIWVEDLHKTYNVKIVKKTAKEAKKAVEKSSK